MKHIEVVAAIIFHQDKILCVQRGESKYDYISKKYEFPGGKVEEGESKFEAVVREIKEELNMDVKVINHFQTVEHEYPDFKITMHGFICSSDSFQLNLNEHISFHWLNRNELADLDWAAADVPFVNSLMDKI